MGRRALSKKIVGTAGKDRSPDKDDAGEPRTTMGVSLRAKRGNLIPPAWIASFAMLLATTRKECHCERSVAISPVTATDTGVV
jgi:hypothetical protein